MNCEIIETYMEAFALDALPPDEHEAVVAHLALCEACRVRLRELESLVDGLVETVPMLLQRADARKPPARLRSRLLNAIHAEAIPPAEAPAPTPAIATTPAPTLPKPRSRLPGYIRVGMMALVGMAILLAIWGAGATVALQTERTTASTLTYRLDQQEIVLEVVDSPSTTRLIMRSPDLRSPSQGKIFKRPDLPYMVATVDRLSQPPPGYAYFLWAEIGDQRIRLGTMEVNNDGFGILIVEITGGKTLFDKVFLTLQPVSAPEPSSAMVLGTQFRPGRHSTPAPIALSPL